MGKRSEINMGIIEDDKVVREGLHAYFSADVHFSKVLIADSVEQFFEVISSSSPLDIVLTDIGLPGMSGIDGIRLLKEQMPQAEILMLTVFKDSDRIFRSICAGANGYILKGTPFQDIRHAVFSILDGGSSMSPTIARQVMEHFKPKPSIDANDLTSREKQIVQTLVDGLSYKLIAHRLSISIDTVRFHIKNIYTKLQVNSKSEVVSKSLKGEI